MYVKEKKASRRNTKAKDTELKEDDIKKVVLLIRLHLLNDWKNDGILNKHDALQENNKI